MLPLYGVPCMVIDDDTLKQLLRVNDELMQLCKWLNEKRDMETSSRLSVIRSYEWLGSF